MPPLDERLDPRTDLVSLPYRGFDLLQQPLWNKSSAFTDEERTTFGLWGLLPPHIETLEQQAGRIRDALDRLPTDLKRHFFLRLLQASNETLFQRVLQDDVLGLLPVVYTPTVGTACQEFSRMPQRPRGLFISYQEREHIDEMLAATPVPRVDILVVTDGERILGLGDQGAGGMGIPIGKLSLYTACGGIHPGTVLPILLDVGTDNVHLLTDPLYVGWRHERIRGADYDAFIEQFVAAVMRRWPDVLLQWEDFESGNAARLLERYRDRLCTFNDDIQGTAAVTSGVVLAGLAATGRQPEDARVVIVGAGSAGCGIAGLLRQAMGGADAAAGARLFMVDADGLLIEGRKGLRAEQAAFAQAAGHVADWGPGPFELEQVVERVKPDVLIGVTGVAGAFSERAVRSMAAHAQRPIILPLSNPTSRVEATPEQILQWTDGRALIATGSPFPEIDRGRGLVTVAQCNNCYVFPGVGLGVLAVGARRVTDEMFVAAAHALRQASPALNDPEAPLLPALEDIRSCQQQVAHAVARCALDAGLATRPPTGDLASHIADTMWDARYRIYDYAPDARA